MSRHERQRGQGLVEFTMVVPVILLIVLAVVELGMAFGNLHTVGYASREGARVGSALAKGGVTDCLGGADPSNVDATLVSAVQRILESPSSDIDMDDVTEIRIFRASSTGAEGPVNVWTYFGPGAGPDVDPGAGVAKIDFIQTSSSWSACSRDNSASSPDSIGVTVNYRYELTTPLPSVINAIAGGTLAIPLSETTVMSLNPSI